MSDDCCCNKTLSPKNVKWLVQTACVYTDSAEYRNTVLFIILQYMNFENVPTCQEMGECYAR